MLTRRGKELLGFVILNLVIALGGYLALGGIRVSQVPLALANNPTPLGYSRSLALFLIPCLIFGTWLAHFDRDRARGKAFVVTVIILFPVGALLDLFLGKAFFVFPNTEAVLGSRFPILRLPAYDWSFGLGGLFGPGWTPGYLPIEEFLFYGLGFSAILLTYIWCEAVLFGDEKSDRCQPMPRLFRRWWSAAATCLIVGGLVFLVAFLVSRRLHQDIEGFPGYFLFLLITAVIPSMVCFRIAFHFVHWRALTIAWLFVLSISQFWEASLALPYQWWNYRPSSMMGLFIKPHCDLPIEALMVWSLGSWTAVMVHETVLAAIRLRTQKAKPAARVLRGDTRDLDDIKVAEQSARCARP